VVQAARRRLKPMACQSTINYSRATHDCGAARGVHAASTPNHPMRSNWRATPTILYVEAG
jgi:hypothetical protein